ncbi:MAG: thioredoxin family protein [Candidatus Lokiarchaeota archaeon]|nr:thioredoxin family protein [Candidatus Lokiarchaeota archaeon]
MSSENNYRKVIQEEMGKLNKKVNLKVFTSLKTEENGSKVHKCVDCEQTMQLLRIYEEYSNKLLHIEETSIYDEPEFAKKNDIQRVPTIIFTDENEREIIRYLANPIGQEIQPFVKAIFAIGGGPNYYEKIINQYIERISPSTIKVMITMQCPYCPSLVEASNLFAIASKGKIRTVIVDIQGNPDIGQYYNASGVPYTIINERPAIQGMIPAHELLRELIGSNIDIQY